MFETAVRDVGAASFVQGDATDRHSPGYDRVVGQDIQQRVTHVPGGKFIGRTGKVENPWGRELVAIQGRE